MDKLRARFDNAIQQTRSIALDAFGQKYAAKGAGPWSAKDRRQQEEIGKALDAQEAHLHEVWAVLQEELAFNRREISMLRTERGELYARLTTLRVDCGDIAREAELLTTYRAHVEPWGALAQLVARLRGHVAGGPTPTATTSERPDV